MIANPPKFQLFQRTKTLKLKKVISFDGTTIKSSDTVELLWITLDKNIKL